VDVAAGQTRAVTLVLARASAPAPKGGTIADFDDPSAWSPEDNIFVHRGAAFLTYKLQPKGVFQFTVQPIKGGSMFRSARIRWRLLYEDQKNYAQFELDKKNFWARDIVKGKNTERAHTQHDLEKEKSYTIQIEVTNDHIVHRIRSGNSWVVLDSWAQPGRDFTVGKFGFYIQGSDELGISDFSFTPR